MYRVIVRFADAQDNNYIYEVGDEFPRKGNKASAERLKELASEKNGARKPVIAIAEPEAAPEASEMPQIEPEAEKQSDIKADKEKPEKGK